MKWSTKVVNALTKRRNKSDKPRPGRLVDVGMLDQWRDYPADGLTPSRLIRILRAADAGAVGEAMALYEQMEEKDGHLFSVANTRRLAITGLGWNVISGADVRDGVDKHAADEAAAYCRETLANIDSFDAVLQHLSLALGRNVAMAENVWELRDSEIRLVDIVPVSFDRITFGDNGELRVLTEAERYEGITLPPNKFVVHTPHAVSGHPMRGGLLRATSLAYLGKHFAIKDWMIFAEVFGMPVRVARYEPSATAEEKRELLRMLESIGSDAAAIFSKAVELQFIEAGQGKAPPPYEAMCDYFNRELSKAWLGQTLTVETRAGEAQRFSSGPGVHNEVRHDLRQDDLVKEARTLRRDVLTPITRVKFGDAAPVPYFKRQLDPPRDLRELADILNVAVNDLNMQIPAEWAHRALGVPYTDNEEQYLAGKSVNHS